MTAALSFVDACADVINRLELETRHAKQVLRLELVAGALLRQVRKRYGCDDLGVLSDEIVDQAFWAEFARVVANWPVEREAMRPHEFFGVAYLLRKRLAERGWCRHPGPTHTTSSQVRLMDDPDVCVSVWSAGARVLYACRKTLALFSLCRQDQAESFKTAEDLIHPDDRPRFLADRSRRLEGMDDSKPPVYRVTIPFVDSMELTLSCALHDDDGKFFGYLGLVRPIFSRRGSIVSSVAQTMFSRSACLAAGISLSVGALLMSLCAHPVISHLLTHAPAQVLR